MNALLILIVEIYWHSLTNICTRTYGTILLCFGVTLLGIAIFMTFDSQFVSVLEIHQYNSSTVGKLKKIIAQWRHFCFYTLYIYCNTPCQITTDKTSINEFQNRAYSLNWVSCVDFAYSGVFQYKDAVLSQLKLQSIGRSNCGLVSVWLR